MDKATRSGFRRALLVSLAATLGAGGCAETRFTPPQVDEPATIAALDLWNKHVVDDEGVDGDVLTFGRLFGLPGSACAADSECDSAEGAGDGFCYHDVMGAFVYPAAGYCTVDDGTGTVCTIDEDCPSNSECVTSGGYRLCMASCGAGGTCPLDQACLNSFNGNPLNKSVCIPGNSSAADGQSCSAFYNCNANSICWNNPENPQGQCTAFGCNVANNTGCNTQIGVITVCVAFTDGPAAGNLCFESCDGDTDCRVGEGYRCYDPDGAGGVHAYCRHPHVGDPCTIAGDCLGGVLEWQCLTDNGTRTFPGGSCSRACPNVGHTAGCGSGAICADVDGTNACIDRCPVIGGQSTCRSGYSCVAVAAANGGGCLPPL